MNLKKIIEQLKRNIAAKLVVRGTHTAAISAVREACTDAEGTTRDPSEAEAESVRAAQAAVVAVDAEIVSLQATLAEREAELRADEAADALAREVAPGAIPPAGDRAPVRVGSEERTYSADKEPGFDQRTNTIRTGVKAGGAFERDVAAAFFGDYSAQARLMRHMEEESVERGDQLERAAGTGAFAGLVVPQYLTELYAPAAAAMRPFADACNHHELPSAGMTVNLSRITTATSAALQAAENTAVSETNIDDTLLTINVQTNAGQQTLSRQAIERGTGVEAVTLDDLFRRYHTNLDSTLLNQAATGLAASSTVIPYTSGTPKVAEYVPITLQALSAVEAAMLDQASGENIIVMHSRRWYWLQNALSATFPMMAQPGILEGHLGNNNGIKYGDGVRGILPNGTPVVVDNNVTTVGLAGAVTGGTQDHSYVVDQRECHLWEDPSAPVFIRAEQTPAASLGVLFVLYGYFAYTFSRYTQAQLISGTGTVSPAFTGV